MCKHFKTDQCWRGQEHLEASRIGNDFKSRATSLRCTYAHSLEELHPASPDLPRVEVKDTNALAEQQPRGSKLVSAVGFDLCTKEGRG